MRSLVLILSSLLCAACAQTSYRCDGRMRPINAARTAAPPVPPAVAGGGR